MIEGANSLSSTTSDYALGKAQHDLGHYQKAGQAYLQGAKLILVVKKYHAAAEQQEVKAIVNSFNHDPLASLSKNLQCHKFTPHYFYSRLASQRHVIN